MKVLFWINLKDGTQHTQPMIYPEGIANDDLDAALVAWATIEMPLLINQIDEPILAGFDVDSDLGTAQFIVMAA